MRMRPELALTSVRSFRRFKHRNNVDLPPPAGPKSTVTAFSGTLKLTSRRDSVPSEYWRERSSTIILSTIVVLLSPGNGSLWQLNSWLIRKPVRQGRCHIEFGSAFQGPVLISQRDDRAEPSLHRKVSLAASAGRMPRP